MSRLTSQIVCWNDQNTCGQHKWLLSVVLICTLAIVGCANLQNLSSPQTSASHTLAMSSNLPTANLGKTYSTFLSVSGGLGPYHFLLAGGTLPPGLNLDAQTGRISGVPTLAGTFEFNILVENESDWATRHSRSRHYVVAVAGCESCAKIEITPANPTVSSGGKIQLSALVSNASNSAVTWTASAGTISGNGLFTAPVAKSSVTVTVTATSVAQASSQTNTTVEVAGSANLAISTSSIPTAVKGIPYITSIDATGGHPPYQWAVSSGYLPPGLQLMASSGALSGAVTQSGKYAFSVRVTDTATHSVQQNLALLVSDTTVGCGTPKYNCSRTDLLPADPLNSFPNVGNLRGTGIIISDPSFSNRIARVTDADTNPGVLYRTYMAGQGGSADVNIWNTDSTLLFVQDSGGWMYPLTFDPVSLKAGRLYVASFPSVGGLRIGAIGGWSFKDPNILYTIDRSAPILSKYDFSDRVNPPTPTQIFDFRSGSHCLPSGFTVTWSNVGGGSSDDSVFAVAYSNEGGQGSGVYALAYKAGKGCTVYNTHTGQVTGDWGTQGTVTVPDRFTIHNVKLSKDGNWLVIVDSTCFSGTCEGPFFWQVGTTTVSTCGKIGCSGHWTEGHTTWINGDGSPVGVTQVAQYETGQYKARNFSTPASPRALVSRFPTGLPSPFDMHASWNNADSADTYPFFSSTWTPGSSQWLPWRNEVLGISPIDGTVWRFAHTYITTVSHRFSTRYGIGSISQDGRFFAFSSDWMGTLGSESGSFSCTIGTNCRGDVFVVALQ